MNRIGFLLTYCAALSMLGGPLAACTPADRAMAGAVLGFAAPLACDAMALWTDAGDLAAVACRDVAGGITAALKVREGSGPQPRVRDSSRRCTWVVTERARLCAEAFGGPDNARAAAQPIAQ